LNIITRKRLVRLYLGCYQGLVDDDRHCVLVDAPLSRHLITRLEELLEISVVSFKRLATLLHQGVKGRIHDVVLVEVGSVGARVPPPLMLDVHEVVDSPVELLKCVATRNEQELEAPTQNYRNRTIQFQKPDSPILSGPMAVKGVARLR
jgi:hypothetical protein